MGDDPTDWNSPGEIPSQGGKKVGGDATLETDIRDLGLPPSIIFPADDGLGGDGGLNIQTP